MGNLISVTIVDCFSAINQAHDIETYIISQNELKQIEDEKQRKRAAKIVRTANKRYLLKLLRDILEGYKMAMDESSLLALARALPLEVDCR